MALVDRIKAKARASIKHIVLPEGEEMRTIKAASIAVKDGIAKLTMLGDPDKIHASAGDICLAGIDIINPKTDAKAAPYAEKLYELRKAKGMTLEKATELVADPMYYGIMMLKMNDADGLVSGAVHSTSDMLRPALQILKARPGLTAVSSCFLIECPNTDVGENGVFVFSDCGVIPDPTVEELAAIAQGAAESARLLCDMEPRIAMLSFSTKGSASHEMVTKMQQATELTHKLAPDLKLDGELQVDAAVVPEVARMKAPGSPIEGRANVLIFPDLQAGNIAYKLAQRLARSEAYGPILQGVAKACNDLSRGCSVDDIVATIAVTSVQAQAQA